jgi:O-antigen ligase/tetratricopeptide (TPR) repeat protein
LKEKISPALALLCLGCFLAPIWGGIVPTDSQPLDTGLLTAILGEPSTPSLQHALIALPILLALIVVFATRKVLQVPSRVLGFVFAAFFGILVATFPPSSFKGSSLPVTLEWASYGAALYAVVAVSGRRTGPRLLMLSIFAGCAFTSLKGLIEYGQMKSIDPNWRIFGGWVNPNALAAILLVGIFLGIGLAITEVGISQLLCGLFTLPEFLAVGLTKSRGGLAVLVVGLILLAVLLASWWLKKGARPFAGLATSLVMAGVVACCVIAPVAQLAYPVNQKASQVQLTKEQSGLGRLSGSGLATDESTYFRRLLWKGTLPLLSEWPAGVGMGNYRYYSGKSGLTTQTQLAHEGYLQLWVDATLLAPVLLAAALVLWVLQVCRAPAGLPWRQNTLRACSMMAVFSVLAHNVLDSDFYYYGIGIVTFVLIGVSLLLSADAVAPEFTPAGLRRLGVAATAMLIIAMFFAGTVEMIKARVRYESQKDMEAALSDIQTLTAIAPYDAETWYLSARLASSPQDAVAKLQTAVKLGPSTKTLRALAHAQQDQRQDGAAKTTLDTALELDPNNLVTLYQLMKLEEPIDSSEATKVAERLVAVEDTLYFKIRSLPDLVPTQTFSARDYLAGQTPSLRKKTNLLMPAVRGYLEYANVTVHMLLSQPPGTDYGGETLASAAQTLQEGIAVANEAQRAAEASGDRAEALEAAKAAADLAASFAKASGSETK